MKNRKNLLLNQIQIDLARLYKYQERDDETLKNILKLQINKELLTKKIEELNRNIEKRNIEIDLIKKKEADIRSGIFDLKIDDEASKNKIVANNRNNEINNRKKISNQNKKNKLEKMFQKEREENSKIKNDDKDYYFGYKQFQKAIDTLPVHIMENLKQMSNNKGYIWRNCWFFGYKKREENSPTVLFEKRGNVTRIHEIDTFCYKIFEKIGKDKKNLVSCVRRNNYIKN